MYIYMIRCNMILICREYHVHVRYCVYIIYIIYYIMYYHLINLQPSWNGPCSFGGFCTSIVQVFLVGCLCYYDISRYMHLLHIKVSKLRSPAKENPPTASTWRIIPVSKWLVTPFISHKKAIWKGADNPT